MAQYQVPQFIEVEDKIFGPLTLKQFIYLAGAGGFILLCFTLLPMFLTVLIGLPVAIFAGMLAFYTVNGRPFILALEHAVGYFLGNKLYLWKPRKQGPPKAGQAPSPIAPSNLPVPKLSESKLKDLSWSLNIKDRTTMGVTATERSGFEM